MPTQDLTELRRQAERFLSEFQRLIEQNPWHFKYHKKNIDTLNRLGFTLIHCEQVLLSLTPDDYYGGPIPDENQNNNLWVFGVTVEGCLLYIKVKIHTRKDGSEIAYCVSFHDPEFPMKNFPLRGIGQ